MISSENSWSGAVSSLVTSTQMLGIYSRLCDPILGHSLEQSLGAPHGGFRGTEVVMANS